MADIHSSSGSSVPVLIFLVGGLAVVGGLMAWFALGGAVTP